MPNFKILTPLTLLFLYLQNVNALLPNRLRRAFVLKSVTTRKNFARRCATEPGRGSFVADEDSSELEYKSSLDLEREKRDKESSSSRFTSSSLKSPFSFTKSPGNDDKFELSAQGKSGFDFGLLILFPVIIGTLFLFFVFPFVGAELAKNSPPPPLQ